MAPSYMSEKQFINEKSFLYGSLLAALAYGVVTTLSAICLTILRGRRIPLRHRRAQFAYVNLMFTLSTLSFGFQVKITQAGFLEQRDFNGGTAGYPGPAAYLGKNFDHALPYEFKGWMACFVLTNWFCDAVLLWRCMVLYHDNRFWPYLFRFLPACLFFASFVSGVLHLIQITAPETSSWATANLPFNFTILYGVVALLVNITLTTMIAIRLYIHRRRTVGALGAGHGSEFTGVISMLTESAVLVDIFVIAFLVPYALRHWFCNIMIQPLIQVQAIAPLLIIYRVAQGKAWTSSTQHTLSNSSQSRRANLSRGFSHQRRISSETPLILINNNSSSASQTALGQRIHRNTSLGFSFSGILGWDMGKTGGGDASHAYQLVDADAYDQFERGDMSEGGEGYESATRPNRI